MSQNDFNEKYRRRTASLSLLVLNWYASTGRASDEVQFMSEQLIHCVTTMAAGFRAACRARNRADRFLKLSQVVEAGDQTLFWLELFENSSLVEEAGLTAIHDEALEILKVMATHRRNMEISLQ